MKRTNSLVGYSGESTEELLSYPASGQHDSLVRAFEEGLHRKASRKGEEALTREERIVLAVRALEREVNNGGYHQFFSNSSRDVIKNSIDAIDCFTRLRRASQNVCTPS